MSNVTSTPVSTGGSSVRVQVRRTVRSTSAAPLDLRTPSGRHLPF